MGTGSGEVAGTHSEAWPCGQGAAFECLLVGEKAVQTGMEEEHRDTSGTDRAAWGGGALGVLNSWGTGFSKAMAGVWGQSCGDTVSCLPSEDLQLLSSPPLSRSPVLGLHHQAAFLLV